ncbi:beta-1,3-galactosyltransferase 1-like [Dreissena polymorpha]|nr:beta-1,3-galactosyltransferase 1-like [Dreissena polymorpha]
MNISHPYLNMHGTTTTSRACKCRMTARGLLLCFFTLIVVCFLFLLFESSILFYTLNAISKTRQSDTTNVSNHAFYFNFTNSTVFKAIGPFQLSTTANSDLRFEKKQNVRFDLEADILKTTIASSQPHLPLNVTTYKKDAFVDLNLTRTESTTNGTTRNSTERQSECNNCFKHDFEYVIQNDHICDTLDTSEHLDLLIFVTTVHHNVLNRQTIRRTWLSYTNNNTANARHVFLLGKTAENSLQESVMRENEIYHDIVQETFIDSYNNLTYKTIMGFKWAATKCSNVKFVMKTDDDMWVNVPSIIKMLSGTGMANYLQTGLTGYCHQKASPIRDTRSKWYASFSSYPEEFFPGFCSGTGYMTSIKVVSDIYHVSPQVPFFHLEDVYVSLCVRRLGYLLKQTSGFLAGPSNICDYKKDNVLTVHQVTPSKLIEIWKQVCNPA